MEIVDENSEPLQANLGGGRPAKYDWDAWFKHGRTVRLTRGVDYDIDSQVMSNQIRNAAKRKLGKARVHLGKNVQGCEVLEITFTFTREYFHEQEKAYVTLVGEETSTSPDDRTPGTWGPHA